ncbi:MAG: hypothetical protein Ta2A_03530 [Treponemataceae bacterium]|nr:MAG: hypothetical protein Ta2A_03530 [Treponemataceae bacterium]
MLGEVSETRIEKVFQEKEPFAYSFPYRSWDSMMPVFAFPLHWHEYYEILYVHSGELCATVDGKVYEARGGDIIIVSGNVLHGFFPAGVRAHVRIFQFEAKIFGECESDWGGGGGRRRGGNVHIHAENAVEQNKRRRILRKSRSAYRAYVQ